MDPRELRTIVETEIAALVDRALWDEQEALETRERQSIESQLRLWANLEGLGVSDVRAT